MTKPGTALNPKNVGDLAAVVGAHPWPLGGRRRIGRYLLGELLGAGGMGEVFEAWDTLLKRKVALKLLRQTNPAALMRFLGEAQLQARVEHPNVCRVFDVDAGGDIPFIAMQRVQGGTLSETCRRMSREEILGAMILVANAVHAAHRLKLVHRDLKPGNILIERSDDGRCTPYVCDFGLALDLDSEGLTRTQGPLGTPAFMAPEQLRGERACIGPQTDVYALGATLRHVLAGKSCSREETADRGGQAQGDKANAAELPRDLRIILATCLEPLPRDRYGSAAALAEDLRRFLDGEPILARATPLRRRLLRRIQQFPKTAAALAFSVLLVTGLAAWNIRVTIRGRQQTHLAQRLIGEMKDIEHLLRIERMLPPHDLRPALRQTRSRMGALKRTMGELGPQAEAPGCFALGRGHQILGETEQAMKLLQRAWDLGYRTPDAAYALGRAHCDMYALESSRKDSKSIRALEDLHQRHLQLANALFGASSGQTLDPMALGKSVLARLEGDPDRALALARQAFQDQPWCFEAKTLESSALTKMGFELQTAGKGDQALRLYRQAQQAARAAQDMARSDERALQVDLNQRMAWMAFELEHGLAVKGIFREAEQLCDRLLVLDPERIATHQDKLRLFQRRATHLLERGQDPREPLRQGLEHLGHARARCHQGKAFREERLELLWILADYELLSGRDPRPTIREALEDSFEADEPVEILQVLARWEIEQGQDPRPTLDKAILATRAGMARKVRYYHHYYLGSSLRLRARWAERKGLDPRPDAETAILELGKALEMNPQSKWSLVELARAHQIVAEWEIRRGIAAGEALRNALTAAERAVQLSPNAHVSWWTLASVCLTQSEWEVAHGSNPEASLRRGEQAIAAALAINPTRAQLHLVKGRLALARGRWLKAGGNPSQRSFRAARLAFEQGMKMNPALAELQRGQREARLGEH